MEEEIRDVYISIRSQETADAILEYFKTSGLGIPYNDNHPLVELRVGWEQSAGEPYGYWGYFRILRSSYDEVKKYIESKFNNELLHDLSFYTDQSEMVSRYKKNLIDLLENLKRQ
jgi:hypothetical protein